MVTIISIDETIPEEALLEMVEQIIITKEEIPHGCNLIAAKISCKHARFTDFEGSVFINYSSTIIEDKGMVRVTITPIGYFETKQHFGNTINLSLSLPFDAVTFFPLEYRAGSELCADMIQAGNPTAE